MIFRTFGHQAPREPLLFLLWMTIVLSSCDFGAIHINAESSMRSPRKSLNTKRDDVKARASIHLQGEFPYRFVIPASHPYSTPYINAPPTATATAYNNQNGYDMYSHPNSHNHQQYVPSQPEFKFVMKQAYQTAAPHTQSFNPNSYQVTPLPFTAPSAPMILLLQPAHSGGHAASSANPPFHTFVLIPTDATQGMSNFGASPHSYNPSGLPAVHQVAPSQPYNNLAMQASPNGLPITSSQMLYRPTIYSKSSNAGVHGLLQRPITVYPVPSHKYYPQKKSSLEPRMDEVLESRENEPSTLQANLGHLTSRL